MSVSLCPQLRTSSIRSVFKLGSSPTVICQSCRNARLLKRPKRPYTFTQLITLSDGSAFSLRTTSPLPVYRSTRDTRNSILWNPSSKELLSVEDDEAGRLAGFRARFGRGYDNSKEPTSGDIELSSPDHASKNTADTNASQTSAESKDDDFVEEGDANLLDLISSFGQAEEEAHGHSRKPRR